MFVFLSNICSLLRDKLFSYFKNKAFKVVLGYFCCWLQVRCNSEKVTNLVLLKILLHIGNSSVDHLS